MINNNDDGKPVRNKTQDQGNAKRREKGESHQKGEVLKCPPPFGEFTGLTVRRIL